MAVLKNDKWQASTLLETVVAMVIMVLVFGIAARIYVHLNSSKNLFRKVEAELLLDSLSVEMKASRSFFDQHLMVDERYAVECLVKPCRYSDQLLEVTWALYDQNEACIATRKEWVDANEE